MKKLSIKNLILIFTLLILFICSFSTGVLAREITWGEFKGQKGLCLEHGATFRKDLGWEGHGNIRFYVASYIVYWKNIYYEPYWKKVDTDNDGIKDKWKEFERKVVENKTTTNPGQLGGDMPGIEVKNEFAEAGSGIIQVRIW